MAGAPRFKIYTAEGEYVAACKDLEDAGALVSMRPEGATIRDGHAKRDTLYTHEGDSDSYDEIRDKCLEVIAARRAARSTHES